MRVVHYYAQLLRHQSGVTSSLTSWARSQRDRGHDIALLSAPPGAEQGEDLDGLDLHVVPHYGRSRSTYVPKGLRRHLHGADLLVLHEGWVASNAAAAFDARRAGVPYVVVPHGVYEPGVMAGLRARRVIREHAERAVLEAATAVHVFFPSEAALVRKIAPRADCFSVPTGASGAAGGWVGGGGYVAWFGRYDPEHKGLTRLLDGWAQITPERRPMLRMHGTDYRGGLARLHKQVDRLGLADYVSVGGPIHAEAKEAFLRYADAYIHPSNWESHSVALVEVLERGIPALVSSSIHIAPVLVEADAAVVSEIAPDALELALQRVETEGARLSERAVAFVRGSLDWNVVLQAWDDAIRARLKRA